MLTGLYPILQGAHETRSRKIPKIKLKRKTSLVNVELQEIGFRTYLLSANLSVSPNFGFIGFDSFYEIPMLPDFSLLSNEEAIFIRKLLGKNNYSRIAAEVALL